MNKHALLNNFTIPSITAASLCLILTINGCSDGGSGSDAATGETFTLDMQLPDSITGGKQVQNAGKLSVASAVAATAQGVGEPCGFDGADEEEPFRNGYEITKFMVSLVAGWSCVADTLMDISAFVPHDAVIYETDNDTLAQNYEADEPTHYSVTDDSATQSTIRVYYGYNRATPPLNTDQPAFYISWNTRENGDTEGRIIIDGTKIDPANRDPEDPALARLDFNHTQTEKHGDMFLRFDDQNPWGDGFRIQVVKDLTANPLTQVFLARGIMNMKAQFSPAPGVDELPLVQIYTVTDRLGNGAAIAKLEDLAAPLELNPDTGNYLGNYIFDKRDIYFFDADQTANQPWDWINKTITRAQYRGARTTPASGGSLENPFDPSLDLIISALGLPSDYFSANQCNHVDDSCLELFNAIFTDGFAGQEPNQGSDPLDWRSAAIASPEYLTTVFPNGMDWSRAFDTSFIPSN